MRRILLLAALLTLLAGLGGCQHARCVWERPSWGLTRLLRDPCQADAGGNVWSYPVYSGERGGDTGLGRGGHGALRTP